MATRSKILFVSHDASRTGAPLFLLHQLRWLRANTDLSFAIILRTSGPLEADFRALGETLVNPDGSALGEFLRDIQLIYANTCTNGIFLETLSFGDIPVITHVHELESVIASFGEHNWNQVRGHTVRFIACSQAVSTCLQGRGVPPAQIQVIHSTIPVAKVLENAAAIPPAEIRRQHGWGDDIIVLGCGVASLVKGADRFVETAGHVRRLRTGGPHIRFVWVGRIHEADAAIFSTAENVEFLGERTNPHPYLQAANIFCVASREDSFPLVMLEAALLGQPVLCFEGSGGAPEFCARGTGLVIPEGKTELLAEKIIALAGPETALRKQMGQTGAALVRTEFDIPNTARQIRAQIERTVRPQAAPCYRRTSIHFPIAKDPDDYYQAESRQVWANKWTRMRFPVPGGLSEKFSVRVEPADNPATVLMIGLAVRSPRTGQILWRLEKNRLKFSRSLMGRGQGRRLFLFTPGTDGHFYLPPLPSFSEPVEIRCWTCVRPLPFWARWRQHFRTWRKRLFSSRKPPAKNP